jgi:gliding motility-associated-like protein
LGIRILLFLWFLLPTVLFSQPGSFKTMSSTFGSNSRIVAKGGGYAILSLADSHLSAFNRCGQVQFSLKIDGQTNTGLTQFDPVDFKRLRNGDYALLFFAKQNDIRFAVVARLDSAGSLLWSKRIENPSNSFESIDYTIMENNSNELFIYGNATEIASQSIHLRLTKLNGTTGQVIWTRFYSTGGIWGTAIYTSDNGFLLRSGSSFLKTDANGNALWLKRNFNSSIGNYFNTLVETTDGFIYGEQTQLTPQSAITKLDKQGNPVLRKAINLDSFPRKIIALSSGGFMAIITRSNFGLSTLVEFDNNMNVVRSGDAGGGIVLADFCLNRLLEPIAVGIGFFAPTQISHLRSNLSNNCNLTASIPPLLDLGFAQNPETISQFDVLFVSTDIQLQISPNSFTAVEVCTGISRINLGPDRMYCSGSTSNPLQDLNGNTFQTYLWSTGETSPSIVPTQSGTYWLIGFSECGNDFTSDTVEINVVPTTPVELGEKQFLCDGESIVLSAPNCNACSYQWSTGSTNQSITVKDPNDYWIEIDNGNGCTTSDTVAILDGICYCDVFMPTAFTPNGDSKNDQISPVLNCELQAYSFSVYSRWGELLFKSVNPLFQWDGMVNGSQCTSGVYFYSVEYQAIVKGEIQEIQFQRGYFHLIN